MKLLKFPAMRQTYNYDCGAKATQAVLSYYGIDGREDKLIKALGTSKKGTPISGIIKIAKKYGFKCKFGEMTIDDLKAHIDKNHPVIVVLQAWTEKKNVDWENDWIDGHYVVAIGYDHDKIYFEDSSSVLKTYLTFEELRLRWHDVDAKGRRYFQYGIVFFGKKGKYKDNSRLHMD